MILDLRQKVEDRKIAKSYRSWTFGRRLRTGRLQNLIDPGPSAEG
jgi:hypothetical protein